MNCLECQKLLQRRLDRESFVFSSELDEHLALCPACREYHAAVPGFLNGLQTLTLPLVPPGFSQRMTKLVVEDRLLRRRRTRLRLLMTGTLAASVTIMVLAGYWLIPHPGNPKSQSNNGMVIAPNDKSKKNPVEPRQDAPQLTNSVIDARNAFATLSERWAAKAKKQTQAILLAANPISNRGFENLPNLSDPLELKPAAQSLQRAGQGVADTLQPVAKSARQALAYFYRELPVLEGNH